ncbi:MAG: leucyl/phenylalanyl-tRNA--protein transferase [Bdellovibrionales bacterium]|nr:leucyl/phenylalanyl-tRNA--protein transferase [Bdellovibrionales bacterium]
MGSEYFPPVEEADEWGLLAVGGDLSVETLLLAYRSGIFPWPVFESGPLAWFAPPERALLFIDEFRIGRSLTKRIRKANYEIRVNTSFVEVLEGCADVSNRQGQHRTWITAEMIQAYRELHYAGFAHSIECWEQGELTGGLYGVAIGRTFAGESMFYRRPEASKLCLCFLVDYLRARGVSWIDCQQLTPLFERFGARLIDRRDYMRLLQQALRSEGTLFGEYPA